MCAALQAPVPFSPDEVLELLQSHRPADGCSIHTALLNSMQLQHQVSGASSMEELLPKRPWICSLYWSLAAMFFTSRQMNVMQVVLQLREGFNTVQEAQVMLAKCVC